MNSELDSPPFDPTPAKGQEAPCEPFDRKALYTIYTRGSSSTTLTYPESVQSLDYAAFQPDSLCAPSLKGWWREMFGPSKAELRNDLTNMTANRDAVRKKAIEFWSENSELRKKIASLEKQVAIWEKTYTTVSELACQRIKDIAVLRQNLNAANEEIERLAMAPQLIAPRKAPRKKKGTSGR